MILKKAVERERRLLIDSGSSALAEKLRYSFLVKTEVALVGKESKERNQC